MCFEPSKQIVVRENIAIVHFKKIKMAALDNKKIAVDCLKTIKAESLKAKHRRRSLKNNQNEIVYIE